ncbi:hypothetical protein [Devosia faecipullorum]|uniref:hypothetical protein n=1 Tax=Devosia faecipullorum TaxID=2755039 RepID=UPI00187B27C3|nr:hypothetical protein [Devosia faecipullorum]MBE7734420.1 hypothetical protein [Devosia faecipullorum]
MLSVKRRKAWEAFLDFCAVWVQPGLVLVVLLSGTMLSFDFAALALQYPEWRGVFGVLQATPLFVVLLIAGLVSFALSILETRRHGTLATMRSHLRQRQSEIDEIGNSITILFDGLLLNVGRKLQLTEGAQVRVSLYMHDKNQKAFVRCGRYSPNPVFAEPGRTSYPDDEGCIAQGWLKEWHFDNQVPANGAARRSYNQKQYAIPDHVNEAIRMKSRLYAARRLDDALGTAVAVLVVEAIEPDHFEEEFIRATLDGVADDFARMIHTLHRYIPNPANAAESGL